MRGLAITSWISTLTSQIHGLIYVETSTPLCPHVLSGELARCAHKSRYVSTWLKCILQTI